MSDDGASAPARPEPGAGLAVPLLLQDFNAETVAALRHRLRVEVTALGLTGDAGYDFVLAVHELVTNAVRHGGGHGRLVLRREGDVLICEVTDQGGGGGTLPVRLSAADAAGGRGLWLAHQLSEGLVLTRHLHGLTATVTVCLQPSAVPGAPLSASVVRRDDAPGGPQVGDQR